MASFVFIALVAAAAMLGNVGAQLTTEGTRFDGYTYASNVIGYVNMTMDYCDIQAAVNAGNFSQALVVYSTGKNSFSGLSRRTFVRFATYASAANVPEPLHDALSMGRNATWLDTLIRNAAANRNGPLLLGLIQVAALKYFLHEVDEGYTKMATYLLDPANNGILISAASGAPHNVDEAFALWAGGSTSACATLSGWARQLGADMDTTFVGRTYLNNAMTLAINEFLAGARVADVKTYNLTRIVLQRYITLLGLQGVAQSAYKAHAATACMRPVVDVNTSKAMISVHWTYLQPLLVAQKVNSTNVKKLGDALVARNVNWTQTWTAINTVVTSLGRRMAEIGSPNHGRITAGWSCSSSVMGRRMA